MRNRRPVILATDRATDMARTMRTARSLAEASGADIHLVRVVPHRSGPADSDPGTEPVVRGSAAEAPRSPLHAGAGDRVRIRRVTLRGTPGRALPAYAQLTRALALIVQHDYGSPRFWRNAGAVEELARRSPVPLLVLPKRAARRSAQHPPRRVLAPFDFSVASAVALRTAVDLTRRHGGRLTLVHALTGAPPTMVFSGSEAWDVIGRVSAERDAVAERLRRGAVSLGADAVEAAVTTGLADEAILDAAERTGADVLVMGVARRSRLDRLVFGSTLRRVLRRARVPVLVVPVTGGTVSWPIEATDTVRWAAPAAHRDAA